jgi:hypothetical protein
VILSGIIVATNKDAPLGFPFIGAGFQTAAEIIGILAFIATVVGLYRWIGNLAQRV